MLTKLHHWWQELRASFWFIPALMVLDAVVLAIILISVDAMLDMRGVKQWPLLFRAGAAGARGLLTAVASSMITVAGVVFSITLVALSLTSSQYTSRVVRNFMRDRVNQVVLGMFVSIFAYCLVVLRTIREGSEMSFVPSLAVTVGLLLAFVGIASLIYFIHYISMSIQASSIIADIAKETMTVVDRLYPNPLDKQEDEHGEGDHWSSLANQSWSAIPAGKTGYVETVHPDDLLPIARDYGTILRMERGVGEFVVEGTSLVSVAGRDCPGDKMAARVNSVYVITRQRSVEQDIAFGIRQIVDVALKALSPGINDTTTAVICVDYLAAILSRLAPRRITNSYRVDQGGLRVIARGPSFDSLLKDAFDQIRQNAKGNIAIMTQMLRALQTIDSQTDNPRRRRAVHEYVQLIAELAERTIESPYDREHFESLLVLVREALVSRQY